MAACTNCNAPLEDTAKFCSQCGTPVTASTPLEIVERVDQMQKITQELKVDSSGHKEPGEVFDFEAYRGEIIRRARKYAESALIAMTDEAWMMAICYSDVVNQYMGLLEYYWTKTEHPLCMPTNKPHAHFALFLSTGLDYFRQEAKQRGYLQLDESPASHVIAFLKEKGETENFTFILNTPAMRQYVQDNIVASGKKDDELFPPPEPLRVEIVGTVVSFTTWDAVLVVYMDSIHKGKEVKLELVDWYAKYEAKIIERTNGNETICAAIFPHISIVRDRDRYHAKVVNHVQAKVKYTFPSNLSREALQDYHFFYGEYPKPDELRDEIRLFKEQVVELDWRGQEGRSYYD